MLYNRVMKNLTKRNETDGLQAIRFVYMSETLDEGIDWGENPESPDAKKIEQSQIIKTAVKEAVSLVVAGVASGLMVHEILPKEVDNEVLQSLLQFMKSKMSLPTLITTLSMSPVMFTRVDGYGVASKFFNDQWNTFPQEQRVGSLVGLMQAYEQSMQFVGAKQLKPLVMKLVLMGMKKAAKQAELLPQFEKAKQLYKDQF